MPRELILGTAGHIDHGKTSLVKALTGTDCDRLPEEKARGITIDIGFASLDLGDCRLGIVDVPGHERFIRNMLAGATGIDLALLVVAADDSVMPQTREHLEILQLLGLSAGAIALTKADLVDATTADVVKLEIRDLVKGTFLESAPLIATSARTGTGIEELKATLHGLAAAHVRRSAEEWFRLAIDRCFSVPGHGTVVTGSVTSGSVKVGDELAWLPRGELVRIRGLQNHDQTVLELHAGMRGALNLAGLRHDEVQRGQELATPGLLRPSRVLTIDLAALPSQARPLKHRAPVRLHLGTSEILGTLSLLDSDQLAPGDRGLAQLFLEESAVATWGQPLVLRSPSATATLGGGRVLQPTADKIRRRHEDSIAHLKLLQCPEPAIRAEAVAWFNGFGGLTLPDLVRGAGLGPTAAAKHLQDLQARGQLRQISGSQRPLLVPAARLEELHERVLALLAQWHAEAPLMSTHDRQRLEVAMNYLPEAALVNQAVDQLLAEGRLVGNERRVGLADYRPKLSAAQRKLKDKLLEAYRLGGFQPPEAKEFAPQAGGAATLKDLLDVCVAEGELVEINPDLYLHASAEEAMRAKVGERLAASKGLTVAEIRDLLGTTRKFAVPFCEYLDRIGVTRREGDLRHAASSSAT